MADQDRLISTALGLALRLCASEHPALDVADDHPHTRDTLVTAIEEHRPDVALVSAPLAGVGSAGATRAALAAEPALRVLLLGHMADPEDVREALAAGAVGFLPKSLDVATVAEGIRRAHAGESPVFPRRLESLFRLVDSRRKHRAEMAGRLAQLSPRQRQVLALMRDGKSVEAIAGELGVAAPTVRTHVQKLLTKLNVRSQVEAVAAARDAGSPD